MAKTVGKRKIKAKKPVQSKKPVQRKREVNLFDFSDDVNQPFVDEPFDDGSFFHPARTTRNLTGVAMGVTMVGIIPPLISTL